MKKAAERKFSMLCMECTGEYSAAAARKMGFKPAAKVKRCP